MDKKVKYVAKRKKGRYEISAPFVFSIINNPDGMTIFFEYLRDKIIKHHDLFINLKNVSAVTSDAILYILSLLEYARKINSKSKISGNVPINAQCRILFSKSGFYEYVHVKSKEYQLDPTVFKIESGTIVIPEKAGAFKRFVKYRLSLVETRQLKRLYSILIECMANTKNHAYKIDSYENKWWMIGRHLNNSVEIAFLDNGIGIPRTIKKNYRELVKEMASKLGAIIINDSELLLSALNGEFRTQTGKRHRGRGLPRISNSAKTGDISDLVVISQKGYVDVNNEECKQLTHPFMGTLLFWRWKLK
jgi:hypothetical protein